MAEIIEWRGRTYFRSDTPADPRVGSPARPFDIPIKGNWNTNAGELGIVKVNVVNDVERLVMFPPRGGAHNPKAVSFDPPIYYENGVLHYKAFCSRCAEKHKDPMEGWRRRGEFYVDRTRGEGKERLQRYCKDCMKDAVAESRHKKRLAVA